MSEVIFLGLQNLGPHQKHYYQYTEGIRTFNIAVDQTQHIGPGEAKPGIEQFTIPTLVNLLQGLCTSRDHYPKAISKNPSDGCKPQPLKVPFLLIPPTTNQ